jgi:hypothetical protein
MVGVVAVIIVVIRRWFESLDTIQTSALWVALVCLGIILLTYYWDWQRKRGVDKLPELLAQLDKLTLDYISNYTMVNPPEALLNDMASLMKMDIGDLKAAAYSGNKKRAEQAFIAFADKYGRYSNPKKFQDNIMTLRLAGGLMNEYNVGLVSITNTPEYQRIYQRIRNLRRRLPSAIISAKINEYFNQSVGLYSMLLSVKPFESLGTLRDTIPAQTRAHYEVMLPSIEGHMDTLISAVRESINDYKQKDKSFKEKNRGKNG